MMALAKRRRGGFTLIELMIVVAIIGILAAIAIPNFLRFQLRSRSSEGKVNVAAIRTAEESYAAEFGQYLPAVASNGGALIGRARVAFTDPGAVSSNFATLGWAPEGQVFFNYAVTAATSGGAAASNVAYTIDAMADLDGDAVSQHWGYFKPAITTTTGGATSTAVAAPNGAQGTCAPGGTLANTTVGPCQPTFGASVF